MSETARTVVVSGGSGLIGRRLDAELHERGYRVVVVSRSPERAAVDLPLGAAAVGWDGLARELAGAAGVVNLAGASIGRLRWTRRRKETILRSRVDSTAAVVDAIAALAPPQRPPVLVTASGIDYAGDRPDDGVVDEEAAPGGSFLAGVCVEWEAAAARAGELGVRVVAVRTALVVGREALALRLLALPFRLFAGGPLGSGCQWFPWVHLDDVAGLFVLALEDEAVSGPVNAVAPDVRRQRETAREVGRAVHRPSWLPAPAPLLRLVLGAQADLLLHGQRARPVKALAAGYRFRHPELPGALEDALR